MSVLSRLKLLQTEAHLESATPRCDEEETEKLKKINTVIFFTANLDWIKDMH
jgi:hypothetical protein